MLITLVRISSTYWDAASVLQNRPEEVGSRTIWVKEFYVHIRIFYQNIVYNTNVPFASYEQA